METFHSTTVRLDAETLAITIASTWRNNIAHNNDSQKKEIYRMPTWNGCILRAIRIEYGNLVFEYDLTTIHEKRSLRINIGSDAKIGSQELIQAGIFEEGRSQIITATNNMEQRLLMIFYHLGLIDKKDDKSTTAGCSSVGIGI